MKLLIRPTPDRVAKAAAGLIACASRRAIAARGRFTIALAGDSSPIRSYERLAEPPAARRVDWSKVIVTFGDDRCVPPADSRSNYRAAYEALLSKVPIPPENVSRIPGDDGRNVEAAEAYDLRLREILGEGGRFDLVLLGMGEDGHTASLFPGDNASDEAPGRLVIATFAPPASPVHERVTLRYDPIAAARGVVLIVAGASKREKLRAVLAGAAEDLPIARVIRERGGDMTIIADESAAGPGEESRDGEV